MLVTSQVGLRLSSTAPPLNIPQRNPYLQHMKAARVVVCVLVCCELVVLAAAPLHAAPTMALPRVSHPPRISDFEDLTPQGAARELKELSGFIQQQPSD